MPEKLHLEWHEFRENIANTFGHLRENADFADVTLVCKDGQKMEAHKLILASSSPVFQNILKGNQHAHPLVFMRAVKSDDLQAILDFLYFGEASVCQDNLESFLSVAEELQLRGLMGKEESALEDSQIDDFNIPHICHFFYTGKIFGE